MAQTRWRGSGEVAHPVRRISKLRPSGFAAGARLRLELRVFRLRQKNQAAVVAKIHVAQFRMPVEAERLDDKTLELARQKIGQEERVDIVLGARGERVVAPIEGIAMRPGDPLDAFLRADLVELALRPAFGIGDRDPRYFSRFSRTSLRTPGAIFSGRLCQCAGRQVSSM